MLKQLRLKTSALVKDEIQKDPCEMFITHFLTTYTKVTENYSWN